MGCSYTAPFQIVFIIYQKIVKSVTDTAAEVLLIVLYYILNTDVIGEPFLDSIPEADNVAEMAGYVAFTHNKYAALTIKYADTPVKIGSFQGFELTVTMNSNMMGGGMSACLKGAAAHTTKLIESFAHNLNRLESAIYNIDGKIERTQESLAKLRLDYAEAQKIVSEPFPQKAELDSKEDRLKTLTEELNQAAIEAKKNAPKREKTCYFDRAKMKRDAMRIAKKPKQSNPK